MKTTIWYEMTSEQYVKVLRDAADKLEKDGYVKLLLPNVELDDAPIAGGAGGVNPYSGSGCTGGSPDFMGGAVVSSSGNYGGGGGSTTGNAIGYGGGGGTPQGVAGSAGKSDWGGGGCTLPSDHKGPCRPG